MRLLVTGGCGFIGSNFIRYWMGQHPDDTLVNVDNLTYAANPENLHGVDTAPNYRFVKADIADNDAMDAVFEEHRPEIVVHFAAESHVDRSLVDADAFVRTNVLGTHVLLNAARRHGVQRFHHISTDEVFGALGEFSRDQFDEDSPYAPRNPYSATKAASDHLVRAFHFTFSLPITISNCANNYGPFHTPEKMIPLAITNLLDGKKIPVYGKGKQSRDWLHVLDHCRAIELILQKGRIGETYCIGGEHREMPNIEVAANICKAFGLDPREWVEFVPDRLGHDFKYAVSSNKIMIELGWKPSLPFDDALAATVQWYRDNESWWRPIKERQPELTRVTH